MSRRTGVESSAHPFAPENTQMTRLRKSGLCMALVMAGLCGSVQAQTFATRNWVVNAPGACRAFDPTSKALRYSVSGVRNAGTTGIYVACSTHTLTPYSREARLWVRNLGKAPVSMRCSFRPGAGTPLEGGPGSTEGGTYTQTATLAATTARHGFVFKTADTRDPKWSSVNLQCLLPPQVEIMRITWAYQAPVDL